ncbi:unnamed protein product [Discula destructiva]
MERGNTTEFQSGLPSPYNSANGDSRSEASPQDQPAAQPSHPYSQSESRAHYGVTATPTSDYYPGPASARSASFPDQRLQQALVASMASHNPSITAQSPTQYGYPQAVYGGEHPQHYGQPVYHQQPRPDWGSYSSHSNTPITPSHHAVFHHQQTTPTGQRAPGNQVFSFVPIPGSQQHKRPRRRYEEIERMYKCGWNGCEKAYGTLNHLNAHVTMQSHGTKRVPEEFKEIRKEWKAKKKAEEATRKQQEDQARADGHATSADPQVAHDAQRGYGSASRNLPAPLSYNQFPTEPQYSSSSTDFSGGNYMSSSAPGYSPQYAQSHQQVYGTQPNGGQTH